MMPNRRTFVAGLAALASMPGMAQSTPPFPSRVIRIVPFGTAGGPIDTLARVYAEKLQQRWSQPVIIDAKPGASGIIAADYVAKAAPDGHTVMFTLPLSHVNNAILMPKLPYDPVKDFTPLSMLATGGPMLVTRASAPYNNLKEFVEFARKQKVMNYGTWGNGSSAHLFGELLKRQSGANLVHVAYKAEAAAHNDLFGEALDFAWANPSTARAQIQGGRMKVLGIAGTRRVSTLPNVPTFAEQGFQGFDVDSWIGVYAPAKLPPPIQDTWVTALREITAMPDVQARLTAYGFEPLGNTPAQFMEVYKADFPRVSELIKAAGVTL
ncbi:MAG: tripartite tricarboxylate transporter substrate binding protein [Polaromonas sp.]|uniref:Bug family tripartite tricarboxylate transporter substrate binding protein n=1 Tax=Polaromonas sp. TaxID=1869339 RepID=UPI00271E7780|nr:tripartite tricarboxylate transporter substrate binding protein [Polaromonas sp.]MDO9112443.1 tripartite tricarboxylate transporter substrate binding protein [Polaromonas sp.]MDP1884891.1 tripartite tricarboxylate transporter substrate binding protein [Polaromonas sp.]MDP3250083.1 tripartite tricarboxylate transporter substrate binding protein [Polaromonas sp.]